jgi:hypothetical protein
MSAETLRPRIVAPPRFAGLREAPTCARCGAESLARPVYVETAGHVEPLGPGCAAVALGLPASAANRRAVLKLAETREAEALAAEAAERRAVLAWATVRAGLGPEYAHARRTDSAAARAVETRALDALGGFEAAAAARAAERAAP